MKTHAIRLSEFGDADKLRWEEIDLAPPGPGEVQIQNRAVGVNFIDIYHRTGLYPNPLPSGLGLEGAGVVEAVGSGVADFKPGDRVAYCASPIGAYAEARNYPAKNLVSLPADIDEKRAAGMMLKGMTVEFLIRRAYAVKPGEWVLFHAAAGGVGSIACQWLNHLGARVIGTAGSAAKAALALAHGAHHVLDYRKDDWVTRVREITGGAGVSVVFDGVGKDTFLPSLDCLKPRGMMVTFGNASGPAPAISPLLLSQKGSLYLTRPTLGHYTATREELVDSARALFDVVRGGAVKIEIGATYPLKEAARAHEALAARKTTGSTILLP